MHGRTSEQEVLPSAASGGGGLEKAGVASIRNGCAKAATNRKGVD